MRYGMSFPGSIASPLMHGRESDGNGLERDEEGGEEVEGMPLDLGITGAAAISAVDQK